MELNFFPSVDERGEIPDLHTTPDGVCARAGGGDTKVHGVTRRCKCCPGRCSGLVHRAEPGPPPSPPGARSRYLGSPPPIPVTARTFTASQVPGPSRWCSTGLCQPPAPRTARTPISDPFLLPLTGNVQTATLPPPATCTEASYLDAGAGGAARQARALPKHGAPRTTAVYAPVAGDQPVAEELPELGAVPGRPQAELDALPVHQRLRHRVVPEVRRGPDEPDADGAVHEVPGRPRLAPGRARARGGGAARTGLHGPGPPPGPRPGPPAAPRRPREQAPAQRRRRPAHAAALAGERPVWVLLLPAFVGKAIGSLSDLKQS